MKKEIKLFSSEKSKTEYYNIYDKALSELPIEYSTRYINTDYGKTHIIHCDNINKPKLILLHCMGFSSTCWFNNLENLSVYFDIYCIDSIGEPGKTETNRNYIKNKDFYLWLIEIFNKLGIDKANIVGWSFGGFLATGFAATYPDRVHKVVALSPAATICKLPLKFYSKLFPALFTGKERKINNFLKWISGNDNNDYPNRAFDVFTIGMKNFRGWARGVKIHKYSDNEFKSIINPFLIIIGDKDPIYKKGIYDNLVKKFEVINNNINIELVNGTHGFPIQIADTVNKRLISFLCNDNS